MDHFKAASPTLFRQRDLFNILVSERRLSHRKMRNKGKYMREFLIGDLVVVSKRVKSSRKYRIAQKLVFKTKEPYKVLDNATPSSYWHQRFTFCEGLGSPGRKVKESAARMESIKSTMVIHKNLDWADTIFSTMAGPLVGGTYQRYLPSKTRTH